MPIDFFQDKCKTTSERKSFGLRDDSSPGTRPAYIDETELEKWIGVVKNPKAIVVDFFAVDNCVTVTKPDGRRDSTCDGILRYEKKLIFVELKERDGGKWLKKGREQITNTILRFKREDDIARFDHVEAYVCNSLRPQANTGQAVSIQKFRDDTGYLLYPKREITVE